MFSKQEVAEPKVLSLDDLLGGMEKVLRRLLGEDVDFASEARGGARAMWVDPTHIQQIVVNLAVNARDACPPADI